MKEKNRYLVQLIAVYIMGYQITACTPVKEQQTEQIEQKDYQAEPVAEAVTTDEISEGNYAYEQLGKEEQQVYDEILSVILKHQEKITLSTTDTEVMRKAYTAVCSDYGGLFWVKGYVFTRYTQGEETVGLEFAPNYTMSLEQRQKLQQQIDAVVERWLGGISLADTEYNKVKYIYDLLSTNTEYVQGAENSQNIISVFLNGETVCQGYACAVQYLMKQLGMKCVIVSGTALGEAHAWNLFQMDGQYYYMDVTWGRGKYLDQGAEKFFIDYKYMAMTTEEMQRSHIPDKELVLPKCKATSGSYYMHEKKYIDEWNAEKIGEDISRYQMEKGMLTLRFADKSLYDKTIEYFMEQRNVQAYCPDTEEITYMADEDWLEISFCFLE